MSGHVKTSLGPQNPRGYADMRFVADFPDKAEMSLNYSASNWLSAFSISTNCF